jgi:hypothetical protein
VTASEERGYGIEGRDLPSKPGAAQKIAETAEGSS